MAAASSAHDNACCICFQSLDTKGLGRQWLPCGHVMHEDCIRELRRYGSTGRCPLCREAHLDLTPVQSLMDRAALCFHRKDFSTACGLWEQVRDIDPSHAMSLYLLGTCYLKGIGVSQDLASAQKYLEMAHRGGVEFALDFIIDLYTHRNELGKVKELVEEAHRSGHARAAVCLGNLYDREGDIAKAIELYEEGRRNGDGRGARCLGRHHLAEGRLGEAMKLFWEAMLNGDEDGAALGIAHVFKQQGAFNEAKMLLEKLSLTTRNPAVKRLVQNELSHIADSMAQTLKSRGDTWKPNPSQPLEHGRPLEIGDDVQIHGLTSDAGLSLNGHSGHIVSFDRRTGRFGVAVKGIVGGKKIRAENLRHMPSTSDDPSCNAIGEIEITENTESHDAAVANAQLSEDFKRGSYADDCDRVLLLKFSRHPVEMQRALLEAEGLASSRAALESQGLQTELPSGAKIFVRPEHYRPTLEAIDVYNLNLHKDHVLVDVDLEAVVLQIMESLPGRLSVYPKVKSLLPLGFCARRASDSSISVSRTFVQIKVPSSLLSDDGSSAPRTVSTTDANLRRGSYPAVRKGRAAPTTV